MMKALWCCLSSEVDDIVTTDEATIVKSIPEPEKAEGNGIESIDVDALLDVELKRDKTWEESKASFVNFWGQRLYDEIMDQDGDDTVLMPPWEKYPTIPRGSIGWRMGSGETYWDAYSLMQVPRFKTRRDMTNFLLSRPNRTPMSWISVVLSDMQCKERDDDYTALSKVLVHLGVVGCDTQYGAFKAQAESRPLLWTSFLKYSPGEFFQNLPKVTCLSLRWYREEPLTKEELSSTEIPAAWQPIVDILQHKVTEIAPFSKKGDPNDYMCRHYALHETVPAPWKQPSSTTAYKDAWFNWANQCFDDIPSWVTYLETQRPIPAKWRTRLVSSSETYYLLIFLDCIDPQLKSRVMEGDKTVQMYDLPFE